jgi:vacuolar fusion protein MON1
MLSWLYEISLFSTYVQMLVILTKSINRCFEKNPKFDMTPLLGGTDTVFSSLIHSFSWFVSLLLACPNSQRSTLCLGSKYCYFSVYFRNPATFLHAYTCLPLSYATRQAAGAVLQDIADSGVLFATLMCRHKV